MSTDMKNASAGPEFAACFCFAIGVLSYLYLQKCVQCLHSCGDQLSPLFLTSTLHKLHSLTRLSLHTIVIVAAITTMCCLVSLSISVWGKFEVFFFFSVFLVGEMHATRWVCSVFLWLDVVLIFTELQCVKKLISLIDPRASLLCLAAKPAAAVESCYHWYSPMLQRFSFLRS